MENDLIIVEQLPVLKWDGLSSLKNEVAKRLSDYDIESLEPTEDNLTVIKSYRAEIRKAFDNIEQRRKLVKEQITAPYTKFETEYKSISELFKGADEKLKLMVDKIDGEILARKIEGMQDYFISKNTYDFVSFDDVFKDEKIIKSKSDKYYEGVIDDYLKKIENDLKTIATVSFEERVLAKYQIYKDLNKAISEVNLEVQREDAIKAKQKEEALKKAQEQTKQPQKEEPEQKVEAPQAKEEIGEQIFSCAFRVTGTREQIVSVREFMKSQGISYEPIKEEK